MPSRAVLNVGFVVVITIVTFLAVLIPRICFGNGKRLGPTGMMFFHLGNMMAAGAILGTALCDLLPESVELLEATTKDYPLALCLAGIGYMVTLFMEVVVTALSGGRGHSHNIDSKQHSLEDAREVEMPLVGEGGDPEANGQQPQVEMPRVTFISAVILTIALSYHSAMAGAAIGAQEDMGVAKEVMLAVLGHKWLESYALGTSLVESNTAGVRYWAIVVAYCCTLPLGLLAGFCASGLSEAPVSGVLSSLSAGTFLFVTFNEIVPSEMSDPSHRFKKLCALALGFALMAVLPIFVKG